jgi:5'-3' exonuclease
MQTLILYGDWLVKRQHFKRLKYENKEQRLKCGGIVGFYEALHFLLNQVRPRRVVVAWDGMEAGDIKYKYYPPLHLEKQEEWKKRKRLFTEEDNGVESEQEEHDLAILRQINKCQRLLSDCYVRQMISNKAEGTDMLAGYVNQATKEGERIVIFSREHEFYQLIDDNVSVMTPKMELITKGNFLDKVGYHLDNELMFNCFLGNSFIDGVERLSRDKISKFFPSVKEEKVTYNQLCEEAENRQEEKGLVIFRQILESRDLLIRNAGLLNLEHPSLQSEDNEQINEQIHLPLSEDRDIQATINYFRVDGYADYINGNIEDFFSVFYSLMVNEREYRRNYNSIEL